MSSDIPECINFDELRERCLGNLELVGRILEAFAREWQGEFHALEEHLRLGKTQELASLAHRLKGAAANVAAAPLARALGHVEQLAREGSVVQLRDSFRQLREEAHRFAVAGSQSRGHHGHPDR